MGVLSDVFIATPAELTEDLLAHGPIGRLRAVEGKGVMPDKILDLWDILDPEGTKSGKHGFPQIVRTHGDTAILSVPNPVVIALAETDEDRLREIEVAWLYNGAPPAPSPLDSIVKDWFEEFVDLLKQAANEGSGVYIWYSP